MPAALIEERNRPVISALADCVESCNACFYNCNLGHEEMADCARLCADCASICELTHTLLSRGSRWTGMVAEVAARVSLECAAECEKFHDEYCRSCTPVCQTAAKYLKELAGR